MSQDRPLRQIVAFIQPFQLDTVVDALRRLPRFPGMSVSEVRGFGAHLSHPPRRGEATEVDPFERKTRLEIFCGVADLTNIVEAIREAARSGNPGDGKIFAGPVAIACRIRTAEWGEDALEGDKT
jgi:nitrogen regulatory protein PII